MASKTSIEWSVNKFNKFLKDFAAQAKIDNKIVLRKFTIDLMTRVIYRTPVDTGRARAGWKAAGDALGIKIPPPKRRAKGDAPFDHGVYEENLDAQIMTIYVANNVHYILPLEYGWSKQAPLGMLRISMAELRSGNALVGPLMKEYQASWGDLPGKKRFKVQKSILTTALDVDNKIVPNRKPKGPAPKRNK